MKFSLFNNSKAKEPSEMLDVEEFVRRIREGHWMKQVLNLKTKSGHPSYKKLKENLPGVTISGEFKSRDKYIPVSERLRRHTGLIALDIDAKDNPKMRVKDLVDKECLMQYISCSGAGMKIIYRCATTKNPAEHRRIYDAAVLRLHKKGYRLKVDPIVKSISSMQFVSYDPNIFYFPKTKLVIHPLPAIKRKKVKPSEDQEKDLAQLEEYIEALGDADVTKDYESWLRIAMGLSYSLGEAGRAPFHAISKNYPEYEESECDEKYDSCVERDLSDIENPVTLATVFQELNKGIPAIKRRQLAKKYNSKHSVGADATEDEDKQSDLAGMVRYRLFLFKKLLDKETSKVVDLIPGELNLNEFERLLRGKGFYRYEDMYVQIVDNIVERVDEPDILRIITDYVESEGDYDFSYDGISYHFSWEELAHLWRKVRALGTTFNQIATCLTHWTPVLLQDANGISYIPFRNGVLEVTKNARKLLPYKSIKQQIWKERILPRDFKYSQQVGMFEEFFQNVCSDPVGKKRERTRTDRYKRSMWYLGYMLHGFKLKSMARAWMLYDIQAGNNGRTGKTIIGQAVGHIRNVTLIDGKQVDFRNRFWLQKVTPWTEIVFIDDPARGMSLLPLFNMITGETDSEKKGKDPVTRNLKFMFASNWIMELEGTSEIGRQFVTQLDDYYVRYSKQHNNCLRPIVQAHGKEFFTEWDEKDWSEFDSFCTRCLQYHLGNDVPENTIIGNAVQVRFLQQNDVETFFELSRTLVENVRSKDGVLLVPQKVMVNVLKDASDSSERNGKYGRIIRDYLKAIGAGEVKVGSIMIGNQQQLAYKVDKKFNQLNFGDITSHLPKPRNL